MDNLQNLFTLISNQSTYDTGYHSGLEHGCEELQELLLVQSNITTIILAFTAVILLGVIFDISIHIFKKYKKQDGEK